MTPDWFRRRGYRHLDRPVSFANFGHKVTDPAYVSTHSFLPLIHFKSTTRRYDPDLKKHELKPRDIYFASHRDAHIYAYYASELLARYETYLGSCQFSGSVLAYRALGRDNVDFALEAFAEIENRGACVALCFDLRKFFDSLDHAGLKKRVARVLGEAILPEDWYKVFRNAACFSFVERDDLNRLFSSAISSTPTSVPYCSVEDYRSELRAKGAVYRNSTPSKGVAQGLPISAVLSNVYMIDFDDEVTAECLRLGASYRRYSDDILIICSAEQAPYLRNFFEKCVAAAKLQINASKTDEVIFSVGKKFLRASKPLQYLGLTYDGKRRLVRSASISRFAHRIIKGAKARRHHATASIMAGKTVRFYKKSLIVRLTHLAPKRSFYGYIRKVTAKSQSKAAKGQVRRYWKILQDHLNRFP